MRFSCEKLLLQNAINNASRVTATNSANPILEGLLLEASETTLSVTGYNMQTGICTLFNTTIEEPGSLVLNAKLLGNIIRRMPDNILTFTADNDYHVHLTCADTSFHITGMNPQDFPQLPEVEQAHQIVLPQRTLRSMVAETSYAVSTMETRPIHTGSLFEIQNNQLTIVSIDGFRLALRQEPLHDAEMQDFNFVVPGTALREVEKLCDDTDNPITVTLDKRHILFQTDSIRLICHRLEGEFINYKKSIPHNNAISLTVDKKAFITALDRVSVIISPGTKSYVRCTFDTNQVTLTVNSAEGGAKDICPITSDNAKLEIGFNNRYLMDAFRFAPTDQLRLQLNTSISPCVITAANQETSNFLYMVLPVRLKNN